MDSLEQIVRDMGVMRPQYDDYHEIYTRLSALVQGTTDRERGAYDGVSLGPDHHLIARLVNHIALGMADLDGRTHPDESDRENARELVAKVRRMPHPDRADPGPDVVTSSEVNDLPVGSVVVACEKDGTPLTDTRVQKIRAADSSRTGSRNRLGLHSYYRVINRAPEPPVKVGDEITGKRANALPDGSVIRHLPGSSGSYPLTKRQGEWRTNALGLVHEPGSATGTFRVLDLGGN